MLLHNDLSCFIVVVVFWIPGTSTRHVIVSHFKSAKSAKAADNNHTRASIYVPSCVIYCINTTRIYARRALEISSVWFCTDHEWTAARRPTAINHLDAVRHWLRRDPDSEESNCIIQDAVLLLLLHLDVIQLIFLSENRRRRRRGSIHVLIIQ